MIIERAISIAADAHTGQKDKQGQPYIFHVLRVMLTVPDDLKIAAVLHDVIEDTPLDFRDLCALGVDNQDLGMLMSLTRNAHGNETYLQYIRRVQRHSGAVKIKIADLRDNLDPDRNLVDESLIQRYKIALALLLRKENSK